MSALETFEGDLEAIYASVGRHVSSLELVFEAGYEHAKQELVNVELEANAEFTKLKEEFAALKAHVEAHPTVEPAHTPESLTDQEPKASEDNPTQAVELGTNTVEGQAAEDLAKKQVLDMGGTLT